RRLGACKHAEFQSFAKQKSKNRNFNIANFAQFLSLGTSFLAYLLPNIKKTYKAFTTRCV
ncbi:MAG: hypothetical protein ACI4DK_11415, partial [Lachnospiraceae bacterium]